MIAADPAHVLALSPFILGEVGKALSYPHIERLLAITAAEISEYVEHLRAIARIVEPSVGLPVVLTDPQDDPIVYTAVGAGADVLCARDRAFYLPNVISFCKSYGIDVLNELELLAKLRS